ERAEKSFQQARTAVDYFSRVAEEEMAENPFMTNLRRELLEHSLSYYQTFIDEHQADRMTESELAGARARVTAILDELGANERSMRAFTRVSLLTEPSVQLELGLTQQQTAKAVQLREQNFEGRAQWDSAELSDTQRAEQQVLTARQVEREIWELLSAKQSERLAQIAIQCQGAYALSDSDVAKALGLTEEQRAK